MSDILLAEIATLGGLGETPRSRIFDRWTLKMAKAVVATRNYPQADINRTMRNGDHWMKGAGWVGPSKLAGNPKVNDAALDTIHKTFVFRNVLAEVNQRHVNGVMARPPHWKVSTKRPLGTVETEDEDTGQKITETEAPAPAEEALINEAQAALQTWWDKRNVMRELQDAVSAMLNAKRGVLRMYVPPGAADEDGTVAPTTLEEALDLLYVQHMGTNEDTLDLQFPNATVYTDKSSRRQIGLFCYKEEVTRKDRAELTYLDEDGETVLRVVDAKGDVEAPMVLPLGGRLTMFEMARRPLITEAIVTQQKQLNMTMSMKGRNSVVAGFAERVFFDVDWPGKTVTENGEARFVPEPIHLGPGMATSLQGAKYKDRAGNEQYRSPSVQYRDPTSPETFIKSEESTYLSILQDTQQLHYALAGDAVVSALSRIQARDAFKADLQMTAAQVQGCIRWILETALAWAAFFVSRAGAFDEMRVYAQCKIDAGPIGPDDMRVAKEMFEGELWAKETAQSHTGIEDVDAENQRIAQERTQRAKQDAENMAHAQKLIDTINPPKPENEDQPTGEST